MRREEEEEMLGGGCQKETPLYVALFLEAGSVMGTFLTSKRTIASSIESKSEILYTVYNSNYTRFF